MRPKERYPTGPFDRQLAVVKERAANVSNRARTGDGAGSLLDEAVAELGKAVEELFVANEELHVQNEASADARLTVEEGQRRYQSLFESAPDAYLVTDIRGTIQEANTAALTLFGFRRRSFLVGKPLAHYVAEEARTEFLRELTAMTESGQSPQSDLPSRGIVERNLRLRPRSGKAIDAAATVALIHDLGGQPVSLRWLIRDVTPRRQAEVERYRLLADTMPQIAWTAGPEGGLDYYNRVWYEFSGLSFSETRGWGWQGAIHPDDLERTTAAWTNALKTGTMSEVECRVRRADGVYRWHLTRSVPVKDGAGRVMRWVGTATDIQDHRELEEERERLLADTEARAEREAVVNRIGQAVLAARDPEEVQATAVAALGEHLGVDRCYFTLFDRAEEWATVGDDWHRDDVPPLKGRFRLAEYRGIMEEYRRARTTLVIPDLAAETRFGSSLGSLAALRIRSSVRVPIFDGESLVAVLGVAMADEPREWTADEVALVETVAAQTRAAVDAASLRWRERNIATQLQDALRPAALGHVPGLALQEHYHAALSESEIGGDFYDVFAIEKGCHALVVGDVSGKGLAAATQVAALRNMLRYALLSNTQTLAEAITALNRTLAEHGLLTGFATLFVGTYDSGTRTLNYVNAGQEAGLLWRAATGAVQQLPPTGPILGAITDAQFTDVRVSLAPKDCLAVFTDGLTDAGPTHLEMLGVEGVEALLLACAPNAGESAQEVVECVAERLIAGMEAHAKGVIADDVCLLVGGVEG